MTKKVDTDPNFPAPPASGEPAPLASGTDLVGFQGPVALDVKETARVSEGKEAAEFYAVAEPAARVAHDTVPNARVILEKTPVPPPSGSTLKDPPGVETDPGARVADTAPGRRKAERRRNAVIAFVVVAVLLAFGAVVAKLAGTTEPVVNATSATVSVKGPPTASATAVETATTTATATATHVAPSATAAVPTVKTTSTATAPSATAAPSSTGTDPDPLASSLRGH
jgi:hypothetical protein